jgi:hypothetical protein
VSERESVAIVPALNKPPEPIGILAGQLTELTEPTFRKSGLRLTGLKQQRTYCIALKKFPVFVPSELVSPDDPNTLGLGFLDGLKNDVLNLTSHLLIFFLLRSYEVGHHPIRSHHLVIRDVSYVLRTALDTGVAVLAIPFPTLFAIHPLVSVVTVQMTTIIALCLTEFH